MSQTKRSDAPYAHRFHAGNLGDVWKHTALIATLQTLTEGPTPLHVVDAHAGNGRYRLGPTGEWTAGVGRLDAHLPDDASEAVLEYVAATGWHRKADHGGAYPGSPVLTREVLRPEDRLTLVDIDDAVRLELNGWMEGDERVIVRGGDGFSALVEAATVATDHTLLGLIDPPYTTKAQWLEVTDTVIAVHLARPEACLMVWYPVKSAARPNALKARLRAASVPATALELMPTPFFADAKRRNALNGSGVLLVNPPMGLIARLCAAAPALGQTMATRGAWSLAVDAWGVPQLGPHDEQ